MGREPKIFTAAKHLKKMMAESKFGISEAETVSGDSHVELWE